MQVLRRFSILWLVLFSLLILRGNPHVDAAGTNCSTTSFSSGAYSVTVCLTAPADGAVITGTTTVTTSVSVAGTSPGVQSLQYDFDGQYLLTEFASPYTFDLPSDRFVDGVHTLSVKALMKDLSVTSSASISLTFANGVVTPPVNTNQFTPTAGTTPAAGKPFVVAAMGDGPSDEMSVVNVSSLIASFNPNLLLYLGDVYDDGTMVEFYNWYRPANLLGQFRSITNPTVGNHEYVGGSAPGYFDYWDNVPHYYSFDANGWHLISLDSNGPYGQLNPGSPQYEWLAQDLAANTGKCKIAYFHHPLFNVGPEGESPSMSAIWSLLAQYGVTLTLHGHDHDYQRWVPLDGSGNPAAGGVTEFVVGTGGHGIQQFVTTDSRLGFGFDTNQLAFGALRLKLNAQGVGFDFINTQNTIVDSGVIPCSGAPADTTAPSRPTGLTATTGSTPQVTLSWNESLDNTGVAGYTIYRNDSVLATVNGGTHAYADTSVLLATTYSYTVDAFDLAGNHSSKSTSVAVTTPSAFTLTTIADSYVDHSDPAQNYGTIVSLRTDTTPIQNTYLRFSVQGWKPGASAILRLYSNVNSNIGYSVRSVADNSWGERTITYQNAPAFSTSTLAASGTLATGTWSNINISSAITGNGDYSFALTTTSTGAINLASRETGTSAPQLVVQIPAPATSTPTPTRTFTPLPTPTQTATPTSTPILASTPTPTLTPIPASTATPTRTGSSGIAPTPTLQPQSSGTFDLFLPFLHR